MECEKHGTVEINQRVIRQTCDRLEWWPTDCPICDKERRADRDKKEAARKKKEAAALEDRRRDSRIRASGVPRRFMLAGFDTDWEFESSRGRIITCCKMYVDEFEDVLKDGRCLIMTGGVGTGKTHLACAIANKVVQDHSVFYTTAIKLSRMVKDTYSRDSKETESEVISRLVHKELLIIDEVGMQFGSDAEKMILFEVINGRYENMRPTILSANMTLPELKNFVGDRVIDRMRENGGKVLVFDWGSRR